MFIVIDFVGNIRTWLARGMEDVKDYYLCYLPYILYLISPVVLFLAVIASIGNMAKHLELTAIQSSGRSMFRALTPIFFIGIIVTVLSFILSEQILPEANHKRLEIMETTQQKRKNKRVKEKHNFAFIDSEHASWFLKYYSSSTKSGRDITILLKENGRLVTRFDAKRFKFSKDKNTEVPDSSWILERGYKRDFAMDGSVSTQEFAAFSLQNFTKIRPEDLINERQTGDELSAKEIKTRIELLKRSGEDTKILETAFHSKFANPFCNLIVLLIGASLCHRFTRSGGLSQKFGIGIFFVFSYYIVIRLGLKMGENGAFSPWISAYGPHILFGIIASCMLYKSFRV